METRLLWAALPLLHPIASWAEGLGMWQAARCWDGGVCQVWTGQSQRLGRLARPWAPEELLCGCRSGTKVWQGKPPTSQGLPTLTVNGRCPTPKRAVGIAPPSALLSLQSQVNWPPCQLPLPEGFLPLTSWASDASPWKPERGLCMQPPSTSALLPAPRPWNAPVFSSRCK